MFRGVQDVRFVRLSVAVLLVAVMLLTSLLTGCDSAEETVPVVVVTATPTVVQQIVVVTATFTPELATATLEASDTPDLVATQIAIEEAAHATMTASAPTPTSTIRPTDTLQPTATQKPTKVAATRPPNTPTPVPATYAPPALLSPAVNANCYREGGCTFTWAWGGTLKADEYFQVQLIGPSGEHRGIHPPTKGSSFTSDDSVYLIVADWCNVYYFCHLKWTVAIIKWDGVDPSKIGRTIITAEPRDIVL